MTERLTLTVQEAADLIGISRAHAYELVKQDALPSVKLGRRVVIPRRALERFLDPVGRLDPNGADGRGDVQVEEHTVPR